MTLRGVPDQQTCLLAEGLFMHAQGSAGSGGNASPARNVSAPGGGMQRLLTGQNREKKRRP